MDTPTIPRMPTSRRPFWIGIGGFVAYLGLLAIVQPTQAQFTRIVIAVFLLEILAPFAFVLYRIWQLRRIVRALRRLGAERRALVLDEIDDEMARAFLATLLLSHGYFETEGAVVRFQMSPIDRREYAILKWVSFGVAAGTLGMASFERTAGPSPTLLLAAVGLAAVAMLFDHAHRRSFRLFEVSVDELVEVDRQKRTVLRWRQGAHLIDQPWWRRVKLQSADGHASIGIPYSVVGFDRLLALVISHGRFRESKTDR